VEISLNIWNNFKKHAPVMHISEPNRNERVPKNKKIPHENFRDKEN